MKNVLRTKYAIIQQTYSAESGYSIWSVEPHGNCEFDNFSFHICGNVIFHINFYPGSKFVDVKFTSDALKSICKFYKNSGYHLSTTFKFDNKYMYRLTMTCGFRQIGTLRGKITMVY